MNVTYRCSCGSMRTAHSPINNCGCGTRASIRQNGDVGYQIDLQRPASLQAGVVVKDGQTIVRTE